MINLLKTILLINLFLILTGCGTQDTSSLSEVKNGKNEGELFMPWWSERYVPQRNLHAIKELPENPKKIIFVETFGYHDTIVTPLNQKYKTASRLWTYDRAAPTYPPVEIIPTIEGEAPEARYTKNYCQIHPIGNGKVFFTVEGSENETEVWQLDLKSPTYNAELVGRIPAYNRYDCAKLEFLPENPLKIVTSGSSGYNLVLHDLSGENVPSQTIFRKEETKYNSSYALVPDGSGNVVAAVDNGKTLLVANVNNPGAPAQQFHLTVQVEELLSLPGLEDRILVVWHDRNHDDNFSIFRARSPETTEVNLKVKSGFPVPEVWTGGKLIKQRSKGLNVIDITKLPNYQ
jgi:WD40 repeat protein